MQFDKIFLGNTPCEQRKYLYYFIEKVKEKFDTFIVPAVGQFAMPAVLMNAGIKPEQIFTSDISIFSSVMGYYTSGQAMDSLPIIFHEKANEDRYRSFKTDLEKAAYILLVTKQNQLRGEVLYEKIIKDEIEVDFDKYMNDVKDGLEKARTRYTGMDYAIQDLREIIHSDYNERTLVCINPPAFAKDYEKMFQNEVFGFESGIEEFDLKKEYNNLYEESKQKPYTAIWYKYQTTEGLPQEDVYFAREYTPKRVDYWLITRDLGQKKMIKFRKEKEVRRYKKLKIFNDDDKITEDSVIDFIHCGEEHALYYLDLFAHKLGDVKAEQYYLVVIDGKIFSVCGFHLSDLFRCKTDKVFELFGFSCTTKTYRNINRLFMLLITSREFEKYLVSSMSKKNRFYELNGIKTTCLSTYRKVKLNNGILPITKREKQDNDLYKIMYEAEFREDTFKDCIKMYLEELDGKVTINDAKPLYKPIKKQ